jgi:betaine-aldehyde dehydrogenase
MAEPSLLERPQGLYIDGKWRAPAVPEPITVLNPSTGEPLSSIGGAGTEEVNDAVAAAQAAFAGWRSMSGRERGAWLDGFAKGLTQRLPALVELQMLNNGKPRGEAETDVRDAIATFEYYADLAARLDEEQNSKVPLPDSGYIGKTRFEPLGPIGMIVPWNFPLVTSAWKVAPALAAGCTVVLKTSEYTPFAELVYADIAVEIGLPTGVLNILTGSGAAGATLAADRRLRKVSFTGSNAVGSKVMSSAAERCMPVSLELGGKSPIVVFADAPVEQAVECIIGGIFYNCGQMCSATSRLIIEEGAAAAVLDHLVERCQRLKVGSPFEAGTEMGPLTTAPQYRKVVAALERAETSHLRCLTGGKALHQGGGFFVLPTVYDDVPVENPVWTEEIFGPVLAIRRFQNETEAIALANRSDFGLVATIITSDPERAERVAAEIDAGHVWVNSVQVIFPQTAWGGFKASGIGRELGPWGLHSFTGVKHITLRQGHPQ